MNDPVTPADNRLVVIQRNPRSGSGAGRKELLVLIRELRTSGHKVRMFRNRSAMDAWLSLPERIRQLRCIIAAGGDGTVSDIVNRHPDFPIAILPLGTENLLAKFLKVPRCGRTVAQIVFARRVRHFDSATANGQRFLLMLSAGVDGDIVNAVHAARKGTIRRIGYVLPSIQAFLTSTPQPLRVTTSDGLHDVTGTHVIVTNIPRYGFGMQFAPEAVPNDGLLDVRVYHGSTRWQIFWHAIRVKFRLPLHAGEYTKFTTKDLTLESACRSNGIPGVQADGDPCSVLPVHVVIEPSSLCLLVR